MNGRQQPRVRDIAVRYRETILSPLCDARWIGVKRQERNPARMQEHGDGVTYAPITSDYHLPFRGVR